MGKGQMDIAELYRETGPAILAYFCQHRSTKPNAEDLLQETFFRALSHKDRVLSAASPRAYIFGIARHVRLGATRERPAPDEILLPESHQTVETEDPRLHDLRHAIQQLKEPHRETLLLKLRYELSYEETASVLQIPIGTVRSRIHYAVARLRRVLNPQKPGNNEAR
ncbi:MAG: RNA polymerase sigma factor [Gemmatimonadota bacterium]|nr:RNA polymerase sigma factor [Gemmatimonadota bacterium]